MRRLAAATVLALLALAPAARADIDDGPQGLTNDATPTFSFSAGPCTLDGVALDPCESPYTTAPLADGPHVFAAGTDFRSFTVDTHPPELTLDGPTDSADSAPTYTFGSPEDGATLTCWVDGGTPAPCTSPWTTPALANGTHGIFVSATDAAGNATQRGLVVAVAAAPPDTIIDAGPDGPTKERSPTFGFHSTAAGATFECRIDDGPWGPCGMTAELAYGDHTFAVRSTDAAGNVDPTPATRAFSVAQCDTKVTIGALEAVADCFRHDGTKLVADGPVKVNGITFNPLAGRPMTFDPQARTISLGKIQLRIGSIVLYQGELTWTVPQGDTVTLAKFDLDTFSRSDAPPDDPEAALDLPGDDDADVEGFPLKGEAELQLSHGAALLTGTVELPKVFTDAEGKGLTGSVTLRADNEHGLQLDGITVNAPLAMIGQLELHNLYVRFAGNGNGDASKTCNAASPGLRWEGGADAIVLPTPNRLRLENVGLGFADGAFNYARATWNPGDPGVDFGAGVRVQKIGFSLCAGPPLRLEGRIALTALPGPDGNPALKIPDAGLIFTGGDPWTLRAEAPHATLTRDRAYTFDDLFLEYRSSGTVSFGGKVAFGLGVKGGLPIGDLDAAVQVTADAQGFIEGDRFNADLSARGCFAGTFTVAGAVPVSFSDVCPHVDGVVSSTGIAVCGALNVGGHDLGSIGAGYRWGGALQFMAGTCDVGPWRVSASASAAGSHAVKVGRGELLALRGVSGPPQAVLHGPHGATVHTPSSAGQAVRTHDAFAFMNVATKTTYVVLARPGRWRVDGAQVAGMRSAPLLARPSVRARVFGTGRSRVLRYRVTPRRGQRVVLLERGHGVERRLADVRRGGTLRFRPADGPRGTRHIEALVEQDSLPRRRIEVAAFHAPGPLRPGRPAALHISRAGGALDLRWRGSAARYAVRVATSDGRRRVFVADRPSLRVDVPRWARAAVRVVGLSAANAAGPAATGSAR